MTTTLVKAEIQRAAQELYDAEVNRCQIDPITLTHPNMNMEDAYAIQSAWVNKKIDCGRDIIGYKIGLTSRTMQQAMNIDEPDYGVLLDDMIFADGGQIKVDQFLDPRIEVELAFVLKKRLFGFDVTVCDVLDATDYIVPAIELIAARSYRVHPQTGRSRTVFDTIADNAANAGIITGGRPVLPNTIDMRWAGAMLYINGSVEQTGLAGAVMNHPANGVCWVAKRFAAHGIALEERQIILSGSFTAPVKVKAGDTIHADYGSLGSISTQFI